MKLTESANVQVPTYDVEQKDFKQIFIMAGIALIALAAIIINL